MLEKGPDGKSALLRKSQLRRRARLGAIVIEADSSGRRWVPPAAVYAGLAGFFGWYAAIQLRRYPLGAAPAACIYLCLLFLFALYLIPGFQVSRSWARSRFQGYRGAATTFLLFLAPYAIYCAGTGDFRWQAAGKLAVIAAIPIAIPVILPVRRPQRLNWQDALVLLWLMLPVLFRRTAGIFNVPVNLDFMTRVFLVGVGSWSFLIFRGVAGAGYEFRFSRIVLRDVLVYLGGFTVLALPLGLGLRFIAWHPEWRGLRAFLFDYLTIFLFIAVTEELFFRGLLQNLLEGSWNSRYRAQACASVLFGFSHILHAPFPNWRYVALATVAGWFYGSAYRRNRSLMASATTHALVDTIWRTWFTLPRV